MSMQAPAFVGTEVCAGCRAKQYADWQGSHHDLAMQQVNQHTVLGDFDGSEFKHFDVTSTIFRRDGQYWVPSVRCCFLPDR